MVDAESGPQTASESADLFRQIAENVGEILFVVDHLDYKILYVNPAYEKTWGRTLESLYRHPTSWVEAIVPEDRERVKAALERQQQTGEFREEFRITQPDQSVRWIQDRVFPIRNSQGETYRLVGIAEDITERRNLQEQLLQSQEQLKESNEQLEVRVTERTAELNRLSAEFAHVARVTATGELLGSIAHELNQPLTAILTNAEAARRFIQTGNPDMQEIREILQDIVKDDMRAGQIIHRLRALLQKHPTRKKRVQLDELVNGLLPLIRTAAQDAKARVTIESAPNLPPVEADPVQLQQVVMNLLKNAIDAVRSSGSNGGDIRVALSSVREESIMVVVRDDGPGIPAENIGEVFGAFFTTKPTGLGMGLSVCKTIIEGHGGTISVENLVPRGCSVTFVLPLGSTPTLCSDAVPAARPADSR